MSTKALPLPVNDLPSAKAPGHWVLARLGKRVLRPGGLEATKLLIEALGITGSDRVVEFAPGLGLTARRILEMRPASYTGVDQDPTVVERLRTELEQHDVRLVHASAEASGLEDASADVVLGEAMLTMQPVERKRAIITEAARLLRKGGRYGIHEIAFGGESVTEETRQSIRREMTQAIHHGVTPQTEAEWRELLEGSGFGELKIQYLPFRLLEPRRLVADEGLTGALRFGFNLLRMPEARRRVISMRRIFRRHRNHLSAIVIVATKT
jgi:SAM-dependent methyltransferase